MQDVQRVSGVLGEQTAGRWAVALVATAVFMIGGAYLGCAGSAQAGDTADKPSGSGHSLACFAFLSSREGAFLCNAVGGDGEPGGVGSGQVEP